MRLKPYERDQLMSFWPMAANWCRTKEAAIDGACPRVALQTFGLLGQACSRAMDVLMLNLPQASGACEERGLELDDRTLECAESFLVQRDGCKNTPKERKERQRISAFMKGFLVPKNSNAWSIRQLSRFTERDSSPAMRTLAYAAKAFQNLSEDRWDLAYHDMHHITQIFDKEARMPSAPSLNSGDESCQLSECSSMPCLTDSSLQESDAEFGLDDWSSEWRSPV
jgi:hypothetical protein